MKNNADYSVIVEHTIYGKQWIVELTSLKNVCEAHKTGTKSQCLKFIESKRQGKL
ncbi:MAG: hypothetical protein PF487_13140 [Bacteroidales bacterium]|jgi:hypothetical protein|nr:hypothetical protein [Bacteroidales bacterium]